MILSALSELHRDLRFAQPWHRQIGLLIVALPLATLGAIVVLGVVAWQTLIRAD